MQKKPTDSTAGMVSLFQKPHSGDKYLGVCTDPQIFTLPPPLSSTQPQQSFILPLPPIVGPSSTPPLSAGLSE